MKRTNRKGTRVWVTSLSEKKEKKGQLNKNPRHENCSAKPSHNSLVAFRNSVNFVLSYSLYLMELLPKRLANPFSSETFKFSSRKKKFVECGIHPCCSKTIRNRKK